VVGQHFEVTATITNTGGATAKSVNATLNATALDKADLVSGDTTQLLGNIAGGNSAAASWWLECTGAGSAVINVTAMGLNSTGATISNSTQESVTQIGPARPHLVAEIYEPSEGEIITVCTTFSVAANITNTGYETALDCNANISWEDGDRVELVEGDSATKTLGDITGGSTHEVKWTLHCKGEGAVNITVTPAGKDDLTHEALNATTDIVSDNVTVKQLEKEKLEVEVTAPEEKCYCQNFYVTANISNTGYGNVDNVNATISFNTSLADLTGSNTTVIGTIAEGGYNSTGANWTLHCNGTGELIITVNVTGTGNVTGEAIEASGNDTVTQHAEEELTVEITGPEAGTKYGVCENYTVTANITNTGCVNVTDINATISFNTSLAELVSCNNTIPIGTLEEDAVNSTGANWTLHCKGTGGENAADLLITVNATGIGNYTGDPVNATDNVTVEQKWLKVVITEPTEENRTICVGKEFYVNAIVYNYYTAGIQDGGTITLNSALLAENGSAYLDPPPDATQSLPSIAKGGNASVPQKWHIHCADSGPVTINVSATVIAADATTLKNWDEITVEQKAGADLSVNITSPETCHWYYVGENFTVNANITNTGDALATGVNATLNITGNAVNTTNLTQLVGNITGDGSDTASWNLTCNGAGNVTLSVSVNGTDSVCGGYVIDTSTNVTVHQLPLEVTITQYPAENVTVCSTFGISATITHNSTSSLEVLYVNATIGITPAANASVVEEESETKTIGNITKGKTQEVEWTVHCDAAGDVNITVTAETVVGDGQSMSITSTAVTVTQVAADPTPTTLISYNVSLAKDWNYMSLPLMVENTTIESVLASIAGRCIEVWAYNASSETWKYYNPTLLVYPPGLTKLTEMEDGVGYAIRMKENGILTGQGYELPTGAALPPEYLLEMGWNLVGFKTMDFNSDGSITQAADTMKALHYLMNLDANYDGTIIGQEARFFHYYEPNDGWKAVTDADNMWVGKGYWLYASQTGLSIVPPIAQT